MNDFSGISLLGLSTEVYLYGFQFALMVIPIFLMAFYIYHVTIPIFNELNITSMYEASVNAVQLTFSQSDNLLVFSIWKCVLISE